MKFFDYEQRIDEIKRYKPSEHYGATLNHDDFLSYLSWTISIAIPVLSILLRRIPVDVVANASSSYTKPKNTIDTGIPGLRGYLSLIPALPHSNKSLYISGPIRYLHSP
jgi:hypothetical protein